MADIPNILSDRYASEPLKSIWSTRGKIILEREFWIAVMKAQRALGLTIPNEAINAYELVKELKPDEEMTLEHRKGEKTTPRESNKYIALWRCIELLMFVNGKI